MGLGAPGRGRGLGREVCPSIVPTLVSQTGVVVLVVAAVAAVAVVVAVAAFVATGLGQASRSHPCTETCIKFCTTKATGPVLAHFTILGRRAVRERKLLTFYCPSMTHAASMRSPIVALASFTQAVCTLSRSSLNFASVTHAAWACSV